MKRVMLVALLLACNWLGCPEPSAESTFRQGLDLEYRGLYEDAETQFLALVRELSEATADQDVRWRVKALMAAARIENLYLNDPRRAVARLREALRDSVDPEQTFTAQKEIATIFLDRLSDCRSAAPEIERLVVAFPEKEGIAHWRFRLAQCYFNLEQFEQARAEARLLLEKNPEEHLAMEARLLVANSFFVEKKYRESMNAHQQILDSEPQPQQKARSLFEQGLCHEKLGALEAAEQSFLSALHSYPRPDLVKEKLKAIRRRMLEAPQTGKEKNASPTTALAKQPEARPPLAKPVEEKTGAVGSRQAPSAPVSRETAKPSPGGVESPASPPDAAGAKAGVEAVPGERPAEEKEQPPDNSSEQKGKTAEPQPASPTP